MISFRAWNGAAATRSSGLGSLPTLLLFSLTSLSLFGAAVDVRANLIDGGTDAYSFVWLLQWWPYAVARGLDPLITHLIWFPQGYDLAWATPVPTAALLVLPVTKLLNAIAAYNCLILLAPVLTAWTTFLLAGHLTHDWTASFMAGMLVGFSAYVGGQIHGHPNLALVFLLPVAVLLALKRVAGALSALGFIGLLALVLVLQFGISIEVFASGCVFGSAAIAAFVVAGPPRLRRFTLRLALEAGCAVLIATLLISPYLAHMENSSDAFQNFVNLPRAYSTDLLNFIIPTDLTWLSPVPLSHVASRFPGNGSEQGGYLGLPMILLLGLFVSTHRREPAARATLLVLASSAVASMGPFLWVGGKALQVPLPWLPATWMPLLRGALPARFSIYVSLTAALAAALWLAGARTPAGRRQRLALGVLACVAVLPTPGSPHWVKAPTLPFFTPANARAVLGPDANVILLPYGVLGPGMLWQSQSEMAFTQSGGNLSFIPAAYQHDSILPTLFGAAPTASFVNDLTAFCAEHRVSAIVAGAGTSTALSGLLDHLDWQTTHSGGVRLYRVPNGPLRYVAFAGDYWPGLDIWGVMGGSMTVTAHGAAARIRLSTALRPGQPVAVTIDDGDTVHTATVDGATPTVIDVPADATLRLTARTVFVPDRLWHNGDHRTESLLVSLLTP